jgi:hypothetical protein
MKPSESEIGLMAFLVHIIIESTMDSDKSVPESIPVSEATQD